MAGLTRTWSIEVSRTEAEERWLPLAEAEAGGAGPEGGTGSGERPAWDSPHAVGPAPGTQRDRFTYRISIGYTEVYVPESRLEDPWRELIERARADARAAPGAAPADGAAGTAGGREAGERSRVVRTPSGEGDGADAAGPAADPGGVGDAGPGKPQELL
ncbi:hypothetical protein MN0502_29340 [Arthrobacter sp. MN05-02]|nr:hypothetical protein MN0502_29340 [Arthrobacter sp. MN05-02]